LTRKRRLQGDKSTYGVAAGRKIIPLGVTMNDAKKEISLHCPYCHKETYVFQETDTYSFVTMTLSGPTERSWWAGTCRACNKPMLVIDDGQYIFPVPQPNPSNENIPNEIRNDLDEAKLCFSVNAYRGCAVLARRAMQNACIEKGATKGDLVNQINDLFNRNIITNDIKEWATGVRWIGNDAAHVNKEPVEASDAENSLKLAESLLEILYVIPKISEESRIQRGKTKSPTG